MVCFFSKLTQNNLNSWNHLRAAQNRYTGRTYGHFCTKVWAQVGLLYIGLSISGAIFGQGLLIIIIITIIITSTSFKTEEKMLQNL